uniref:dynein assembly factor 1, axonemal isoform X1 n=1 Tax=Ciona intestinalis TaxID=7719 RepID=UPI00089DB26A|nr:dynein assembly factor 1, axonemal isoform X1 [Ciona intestinalis]|eukprot:XP_018671166.1 dynein assembly factor 1, axonemal isoform X1 [Ciona intestinalis]
MPLIVELPDDIASGDSPITTPNLENKKETNDDDYDETMDEESEVASTTGSVSTIEEKQDVEELSEASKLGIDMATLEELYPGWRLDPSKVAQRRIDALKQQRSTRTIEDFVSEMSERAKLSKSAVEVNKPLGVSKEATEQKDPEIKSTKVEYMEVVHAEKSEVIQAEKSKVVQAEKSEVGPVEKSEEKCIVVAVETMEEKKKRENEEKEMSKYPRMTKAALKQICKKNKLYSTPYLNDNIYLHYKGWWRIENLEEYVGLKCIWLEVNGLRKIENLDHNVQLRCLYLQQNLIEKIENLEKLQDLRVLNLSNNQLTKVENLSCLPRLESLQLAHNCISTPEALEHLTSCDEITVLDVSYNRIEDPETIGVFERMKGLRVLNLMGNPVVKKIRFYRKNLIVRLKELTYLDDRPVFPRDRACAEAWHTGGHDAERAERQRWVNKERIKIQQSVDYLYNIRKQAEERREKDGNKLESEVTPVPMFDCDVIMDQESNSDVIIKPTMTGDDITIEQTKENDDITLEQRKKNDDITIEQTKADDDITLEQRKADDDITIEQTKVDDDITIEQTKADDDITIHTSDVTFDLDDLPDLEEIDIEENIGHSGVRPVTEVLKDNYVGESPQRILIQDITNEDLEFGLD